MKQAPRVATSHAGPSRDARPGDGRDARVYSNSGNAPLLALLPRSCRRLLDVGCGAGDNAALLGARAPGCRVDGITQSLAEAELAGPRLARCWVFDIERPWPAELDGERYDALLFSHVLEHLREPSAVLARFCRLLRPGGSVLIAVPNVLSWRQRLRFLRGRFEYEDAGVLDATHLRFFTYFTADAYLLADAPGLALDTKTVSGSVPLGWLRRHVLPGRARAAIDELGCRWRPNLFGAQILLKATWR